LPSLLLTVLGRAVSVEAADWVWRIRPGMREEKKVLDELNGFLVESLGFLRTDKARTKGRGEFLDKLSDIGVGFTGKTLP
jgi:hypothetical protein